MDCHNIILADIGSHNVSGKSVGHYFSLADNYRKMFRNCKIAGGPIYKQKFPSSCMLELPYDTISTKNIILSKWCQFLNLRALMKLSEDNSVIVFQQSALATLLVFLCFINTKGKIYIISYDDDAVRTKFKRFFFRISKKKINGLICPNIDVANAFGLPYCIVPDYIYTGESVSYEHSYNKKIYDFCIVGRLSPEKGVVEVIKLLRNTKYKLLVAGNPQDEIIHHMLVDAARDADNISLHLGYIESDEYHRYLSESRFTFLNYQGEYSRRSSGVVFDTLFAGVPVVGCRCKALSFIEEAECGFLYDDISEVLGRMELICETDYLNYLKHIDIYRETHDKYIEILHEFITKKESTKNEK